MKGKVSLRAYLTLSYALFVLVVLSVVDLYWFEQQERAAEAAIQSQLEHQTRLLANLVDINQLAQGEILLPTFFTAVESNLQVVFFSPDLEVHNLSNLPLDPDQYARVENLARAALAGSTNSVEVYNIGPGPESLYGAAPVFDGSGRVVGAVCVLLPLDAFELTVRQARLSSLLYVAGIAVLTIPFGWLMATLFTRRLSQAQRMAARVADGGYDLRLPEGGPRELSQLAQSLNRMGEELQQQARARQILLANMTHELARPLGGLRLGIESLRSGAMDERETGDSLLNEMEVSVQRMESLIEDLAVSARPKSLPLKLRLSEVALGPFLHGLRSRLARRAALREIQLTLSVPEVLPTIEADEMRLFQIMGNLSDNALKFTPTGGAVDISAQLDTSQVTLSICDSGPGIPPDQVDRLLEPFVQGDTVSEVRQGMGLGLSIANELIQAHGGHLRLGRSELGGLQASVILPLGARPTPQTGS